MSFKTAFKFVLAFIFTLYLGFWIFININTNIDEVYRGYFSDSYGIIALISGLGGLMVTKNWGGLKSHVGKSIAAFSLGLIFQFLGQISYTILFYINGDENAYPSFGEIFFLATIPSYIIAVHYLSKAAGFQINIKNKTYKILSILIPLLFILTSYNMFLKNYDFTDIPLIEVILDFFYPLGQAVFVSMAITAFFITFSVLGGVMKIRVTFILFSLVYQYAADTLFIFNTRNDTWVLAGKSDLLFLISYFLMGFGLLAFSDIDKAISSRLSKKN